MKGVERNGCAMVAMGLGEGGGGGKKEGKRKGLVGCVELEKGDFGWFQGRLHR